MNMATRFKRILLPALLMALTASPALAADCDDNAQVTALKRAIKADKKNVKTWFNLGTAYYNAGVQGNPSCFDEAIETFKKTLKTNKKDRAAHQEVDGDCYAILGDLYYDYKQDDRRAIEYYEQALKFNASSGTTLRGMGLALSRQGKHVEAAEYLRKAAIVEPDSAEVHYRLAESLFAQIESAQRSNKKPDPKLIADTISEYKKAAAIGEKEGSNPGMLYVAYTGLGMLSEDVKDKIHWFKKVISIDEPKDLQAHLNAHFQLGLLYHQAKKYADMVEHYEAAVKIKPDHALALFNLAVAYLAQGDAYKAYVAFSKIAELKNPDPPGIVNEALVLQAQTLQKAIDDNLSQGVQAFTAENFGEALNHFRIVRKIAPKNSDAKRYEKESIEAVEKGFKQYVKNAAALHKKAKNEDALEEIEKAMDLEDNSISKLPELEQKLTEEVVEAKKLRKSIMRKISGLVDIYMNNGRAAERRGDYETALREYSKARRFRSGKKKAEAAINVVRRKARSQFANLLKKAAQAHKTGDLNTAKRLYSQAKRENPGSSSAVNGLTKVNNEISDLIKKYNSRGKTLFGQGKKKDAQKQFERTLSLDPDDKTANDYVQRITGSQSTAKANKETAKKLYYQGVDFYVNNKIQKAIAVWEKLLRVDPDHADAKANIQRAKAKLAAIQRLKGS